MVNPEAGWRSGVAAAGEMADGKCVNCKHYRAAASLSCNRAYHMMCVSIIKR